MKRLMLVLFIFFLSQSALCEIYQWRDEKGNVHFGEKNALKNNQTAERVEIRDKYYINTIALKEPIKYTKQDAHRAINFSNIELKLPRADVENVRIGRVTCIAPIDIYWKDGSVDEKDPRTVDSSIVVFQQQGYTVINSIGNELDLPTNLKMVAEIVDVKMNICPSRSKRNVSQNATYIKIRWVLSDPVNGKVIYSETSSGSHDALQEPHKLNGTQISFQIALANATTNLLADVNFSNSLLPVDINHVVEKFDSAVAASFQYGNGLGNFEENVNSLKANSAIIKTTEGHGSGVLISSEGYLVTNAHVIGSEKNFKVLLSGQEYNGILIRKEVTRDVALIKITDKMPLLSGVSIAQKIPGAGEEIYVIGTPLALELSQTITKGIVSATRVIQGLNYLQTDASINRGNSGGPVFNKKGELVALTVAGMFTRDGASININYLIPIDDVLSFLNINNSFTSNPMLEKVAAGLYESDSSNGDKDQPPLKRFVLFLLSWLNSPLL